MPTLAPDADHLSVLRVVVKENFSRDLADLLVSDLSRAVGWLEANGGAHLEAPSARPSPATLPPDRPGAAPSPTAGRGAPRHRHKAARGVC